MSKSYTEAQKKATTKYLNTLASISLRVKKEDAERYKEAAKAQGISFREFMLTAIEEKIARLEVQE